MIYQKLQDLIGNTPLLKLNRIKEELGLFADIYAKLEYLNPAGSIKDRVAKAMLDDAEQKGLIKEGATIIEPTSGNTGIGLASVCAQRGYKAVLTMPNTMSQERIKLLKAYGAEVILTDGSLGMQGAIDKAVELKNQTPNSIIPSQFDNPSNPNAHYQTTAKEIYFDLDKKVDVLVATVGSAGTVSGIGKYLKEQNPNVKVVAVQPEESKVLTGGKASSHKIQGIGANFIPKNYDKTVVDCVLEASYQKAVKNARLLATKEGLLCGISSGAALSVAIELALDERNKNKNVVVILPDTGDRYLSTDLFG